MPETAPEAAPEAGAPEEAAGTAAEAGAAAGAAAGEQRAPRPWAVFALPDSRPRLREFVRALGDAGLLCRIERVDNACKMVRRLRAARADWGAGTSFSLDFVTHGPS